MNVLKYIFFVLIFFFSNCSFGQSKKLSEIDRGAQKSYKKAVKYLKKNKISKAVKYFNKAIKKEPQFVKPYLYLASIYFDIEKYEQSEDNYKSVISIDSMRYVDAFYSLGIVQEKQGKYNEAISNFRKHISYARDKSKYLKKSKSKIKFLEFVIELVNNPVKFEPKPLNLSVNTENSEYLPTITGDNSTMIFTRRIGGKEDFYISKEHNGNWTETKPFDEFNTSANEGAFAISSDGKMILFSKMNKTIEGKSFDIFYSKKNDGNWTFPKSIGNNINTHYYESQPSISSDGKTLFFVSNRPNGVGGLDIWQSTLDNAGKWSKPICLGNEVNTKYDEQAPYIHPDGNTLYFVSKGHLGMGGADIFMSKKVNNKWSQAKNVGYPINTKADEGPLFVTLDGKKGYYSSDRESKAVKNLDIYSFDLPESIKPELVTYVKGIVVDSDTRETLKAVINIYNNRSGILLKTIETDNDTFLITLPLGVDYNFTVEQKGYVFYSQNFELEEQRSGISPYTITVELVELSNEITESKPIVLNNIFFETNSFHLDIERSKIELDNLLELLNKNPNIQLTISGHTDNIGSEKDNLELSKKRAKSVKDYLSNNGISDNRLSYIGYGESMPIATNKTEEGRKKNRRTEFTVNTTSKKDNTN